MCGIPMMPPPDVMRGRRLDIDQAMDHIGSAENLISPEGYDLIDRHTPWKLWKYIGHGWCDRCGADVGDLKAKHGSKIQCPACGQEVQFRHEARGHGRMFWQFCLYEWRRSVIDPEVIVLTAAHIWKDETRDRPERTPRHIHPTAIYVFRPGEPVSYFRNRAWGSDAEDLRGWHRMDALAPAHTEYGGGHIDVVMDGMGFRTALEGTRIGRLYGLLFGKSMLCSETDTLDAVASCARRPWLEYLYKAGQAKLARNLALCRRISKLVIPNQRATTPRALLGLTEAQWHEIRRDHIELTESLLENLSYLRRMGFGGHMDALLAMLEPHKHLRYNLQYVAPRTPAEKRARQYEGDTAGDYLMRAPEKLRRKAFRRIIADIENRHLYRDTYEAMAFLGEDFSDPALVTPRDIHVVHDRMVERRRILTEAREAEALRKKDEAFRAQLEKLKKRYGFHAAGLVLRPYEGAEEVIAEGKALGICIGSYARRYLEGGTVICCLRRAEEPDVPWRAVEFSIRDGRKVQDRGYKNDMKPIEPGTRKQLRLFWAAFDRAHIKEASA